MRRIEQRNREEEKLIKIEYLESLHNLHEDWLIRQKAHGVPVLVIDANGSLEEM